MRIRSVTAVVEDLCDISPWQSEGEHANVGMIFLGKLQAHKNCKAGFFVKPLSGLITHSLKDSNAHARENIF